MSRFFYAVIMGPPGSGKGTISNRIVLNFGLKHISCGDLLRSQILTGTAEGLEAKKYIEKGKLVPDKLVTLLTLSTLESSMNTNWLLDGYPRTISQAEALSGIVQISCALNLNVPDEVIISRLKGRWIHAPSGRTYHTEFNPPKVLGFDDHTGDPLTQRDDDKPETVKARLDSYRKQTTPLLDYYRNKNLLQEFHGRESNEIWPKVQKYLYSLNIPASEKKLDSNC